MITALLLSSVVAASPAGGLQPRARPYDAQHYKLELRQLEGGTFRNTLTATIKPTRATSELEFDAYELKFESATVDGEAAELKETYDPATKTGVVKLKTRKPVAAGKDVAVAFTYQVTAGTSNNGFFTATEPDVKGALPGYFTHFEPNYAQRFMPLNDTPADKATSEIFAVVDARYAVVSNGRKVKDEAFSEDGKNLRRVHWSQEQAHSPYLIALAIAQLQPVLVNEEIPSTLWVPPGSKDRAFVAVDVLKGLFNHQVGFTGTKYPWAKLDVVAVPRYYWGGMENTSVIFERSSKLLVDDRRDLTARSQIVGLLAHEMAHQYFGDLVTCAWWDEIWLNEGFASWLGQLSTDDYNDNDEVEVWRTRALVEGYFPEEDGPRSHPLVVKGLPGEEAFDGTSYTKGANVLRMLDLWVGRPAMKEIVKSYLEKHGGKAVTSADFFKVAGEVTKKDKELKPFAAAWLTKKGYPVIFPDATYAGGKLTVTIRQQNNHAGEKGPFVFKLPIVVHRDTEPKYTKEEVIVVDKPEVKVTFEMPAAPQWINWNKDFGALVRVNPASLSEDQWVDSARNDPDPTWRLLAAWQLLGNLGKREQVTNTLPSDAAMGAILDVLTKDPSPYVRIAVLERLAATRLKQLPEQFAAPLLGLAKRPEGLNEDPAGYIRVRRAATEALGRVNSPDGHKWILAELVKRDVDINYLPGYAAAAARISTPSALGTLRAAIVNQQSRGAGLYRRAVSAIGLSTNIEAISVMHDLLKANPGNNEVARAILGGTSENRDLRETQEFANLVRDVALDAETFTEELRGEAVGLLDDVKYESAKQALTEIAEKAQGDRLKASARRVLDANFPAPPAAKDAKKKKTK